MASLAIALSLLHVAPVAADDKEGSKTTALRSQGYSADEAAALVEASDSGNPAEVLSRRTEASQVFANPSGSFTEERYATAQWARQGNKLVDIDTSLHLGKGSISPKAATVGMAFSPGGTGPLATITRDGRSMSLTWPGSLPTPNISDDTVTYPNVLPDVDLKLRANASGFAQLLVVKTAEAAANPALKDIAYGMSAEGVNVSADEFGNLTATNPAGQELFTAPTPRMWDSSTSTPTSRLSAADDAPSGPPATDDFEPGHGAQQAAIPVTVDDDSLRLQPDQDVLQGRDTTYPVYIDPYVSGSRHSWTIAYKKYPNGSFYNGAGWGGSGSSTSEARVGYENETNGLGRSYFQMNTKNLWSTNKQIIQSTFRIKNTWSWSCTAKPVELWRTSAISSSTTWNNRPARAGRLDTVTAAKGWGSACPAANLAFDSTVGAKDAAAHKWSTLTFELAASNESDVYGWKKFDSKSAVLSTEYNTVPNVPTALDTAPSVGGCDTAAPYNVIGNTDVYLTAKVADADGGTVRTEFRLWGSNDLSGSAYLYDQFVSATSGTTARALVPKTLLASKETTARGAFVWKARSYDGSAYSAWTPTSTCGFGFDSTRPSTPPGVTSAAFPDGSDGWPVNTGRVRTEGTFALSSGGVADVTKYEYWTGTDPTVRSTAPSSAGGSVSVKFTPTSTGANHLYARSVDKAGNKSDRSDYLFYANGLLEADKPGDINGDGNADLYGVSSDGTLNRFYGAGNGTVTQASESASTTGWSGTQITRRGDWTGDGYEDLLSLKHDTTANASRLWIHPNNGFGYACGDCAGTDNDERELTVYDEANNHWSSGAKQVLAVGDVDGPLDVDNDGTPDTPGFPDLLINDGTFVWLYYGSNDDRLDSDREPVLLAGPDDPLSTAGSKINELTLAAAGDWNNDGQPDLVVRFDRPDVGGLYVYHGKEDDNGYDVSVTERTGIGYSWSTSTVPAFTAAPDADNDGVLDLWATTPNSGRLRTFHKLIDTNGPVTLGSEAFAGYQSIG
ncbi:FG-GAP-like repeat-containing protein [Streptomyces galilaeus]|uniref:FG-GAP-like repeat-containing protein n=1 Tax=Streptomyces galilaeus TaxID=33899 RepID=UPI0038F7A5BC